MCGNLRVKIEVLRVGQQYIRVDMCFDREIVGPKHRCMGYSGKVVIIPPEIAPTHTTCTRALELLNLHRTVIETGSGGFGFDINFK